ncbi:hypothetical protein DY245_18780 [Streptomyces inhibens]|uniref:Uncharacterized protein n=1 Tax=Streptomyces inhibens TaxID=2293571 RepID=A0A371Q2D3_STRIH|nr:hypothetical protein [Streptomyces inhibens]REK88907.1 hypothetical protein DY245_18780 [Streptomyces inhibens]
MTTKIHLAANDRCPPPAFRIRDCFAWRFAETRQGMAATWTDPERGMRVEVVRPSIDTRNDRGGTALVPQAGLRTAPCRMTPPCRCGPG